MIRMVDTCKGCGEPWPCADSGRTDISGIERARHHRMTQAEADAAFSRLWREEPCDFHLYDALRCSRCDVALTDVRINPSGGYPFTCPVCRHLILAEVNELLVKRCGVINLREAELIEAECAECGQTFDNCHCGEVALD